MRPGFNPTVHTVRSEQSEGRDWIKVRRTDALGFLDGAWVEIGRGADCSQTIILNRDEMLDLIDALGKVIYEYETGEEA